MKHTYIRYPKLGNVLAEFYSIFSILITLGLFGKFLSYYKIQSQIYEAIASEYYDKTNGKAHQYSFWNNFLTNMFFIEKKK